MSTGKHFSPSNQGPQAPKPVVPGSRSAKHGGARLHGARARASATGRSDKAGVTGAGKHSGATHAGGASGAAPRPPRGPWRFTSWRSAAAAALAAVLVVGGVAGVVAWTTAQDALTNAFQVGQVNPEVVEDFTSKPDSSGNVVKENVKAKNSGSVDIYVRAQVNIYWVDAAGNQLWEEPQAGEDYNVDQDDANGWVLHSDGYYYWTSRLGVGATTANLIDSVSQDSRQIEADQAAGRNLVVDIDIQGIQADPALAVKEAWGVEVDSEGGLIVSSSTTSDPSTTTTEEA